MEGDREVVREGDEDKKKKRGWFSREKKPVQNTTNVQRPPSASPFPHNTSDTSPARPTDLSERITRSPLQLGTLDNLPSQDSTSLPIHAGFDFTAISEMLEKENAQGKGELRGMSADTTLPLPVVLSPTIRAESVPPLQADDANAGSRSTTPTPRRSSLEVHSPELETSSVESGARPQPAVDLSHSLIRSLSFHGMSDRAQSLSLQQEPSLAAGQSPILPPTPSPFITRQPLATTLSFGSSDGAVWAPGSVPGTSPHVHDDGFGSLPLKPSFAVSTETLFPADLSSSTPSHPDPFMSSGLSFGDADGSISFGAGSDPWAPQPPLSGSKRDGHRTNPWDGAR